MAKESLDELKERFKDKKSASPYAIFIVVFMTIFLLILLVYVTFYKQRIEDLSKQLFSGVKGFNYPGSNGYDIYKLLRQFIILGLYVPIIVFALNGLAFLEIVLLLPCILFITLPFMFRHVYGINILYPTIQRMFGIQQIPTENPAITFIFFLVTLNLWYVFSSSVDEALFSEDAKALSIIMSVVLIFLYILFKYHYNFNTSDAFFRAIGLTGASVVFMISAPTYEHIPIVR